MGKQRKSGAPLPSGGGEMGERIRSFDWSQHPFGPPETWPPALMAALGICLNSNFPTAIYWGPEHRFEIAHGVYLDRLAAKIRSDS